MGLFSKEKKNSSAPEAAKPLSGVVKSFLERTRPPTKVTPLTELQARFLESGKTTKEQKISPIPHHSKPLHGIEKIVETRIQEWMLRKEATERAHLREREKRLLDDVKSRKWRPD